MAFSAMVGSPVAMVRATLLVFSPIPPILAWRESHWGQLMRRRTTGVIGRAKLFSLVVTSLVTLAAVVTINRWPHLQIPSPAAAGLAISAGTTVEALVVAAYGRSSRPAQP